VPTWFLKAVVVCAVAVSLAAVSTEARDDAPSTWAESENAALRELLEGSEGRRETWGTVPELVLLTSVMDFTGPDMRSGYAATGATLGRDDVARLEADLTRALGALTGGRFARFSSVRLEAARAGEVVSMFRRGKLVVGRFQGVHARAGTLGFGGRTTRSGTITAGAVILDSDFDRESDRRHVLRTHELGHALGYNHVESLRSVMNPRVGSELTDFDRTAIEKAWEGAPLLPSLVRPVELALLQN
jgi:hypothetical protein